MYTLVGGWSLSGVIPGDGGFSFFLLVLTLILRYRMRSTRG